MMNHALNNDEPLDDNVIENSLIHTFHYELENYPLFLKQWLTFVIYIFHFV